MKPVFVFQQVPHEMLGTIAPALTSAGVPFQYVDLFKSVPQRLPLDDAAGLIVLGGPMNVDETDQYPFLAREVVWLQEAVEAKLPVLGVCLGAQLLAKALGARVRANRVKEIGWYDVELTPAAADDPLLAGWDRRTTVFQWHGDTFDLPRGAVHLARSLACENQAFRYGDAAYALQFHVEMTAEMIDDWLGDATNCGELAQLDYVDPREIRRRTPAELPAMQALAAPVFGRFAALCRARVT